MPRGAPSAYPDTSIIARHWRVRTGLAGPRIVAWVRHGTPSQQEVKCG